MATPARVIGVSAVLLLLVAPALRAATASPIADAVQAQDQAAVKALLAKSVDVNVPQADGTTALHWAAHHNDVALADLLLRNGARVSAANRYGVTPLSLASAHGSAVEMIDKLLKAGADPNTTLKEGETVLMLAARTGNAVAVKLLLAYGADPNRAEGWRKQTALMWAAEENHGEAVKTLIEGGANIHAMSNNRFTALMFAVRAGHAEVLDALLHEGANPNDELRDGTSALHLAALNAHWELGIKLLEWGANATADDQGWNALHQVALTRNPHHDNVAPQPIPTGGVDSLDFAKKLIEYGADVNSRTRRSPTDGFRQWIRREGATALFLAAKAADVPLMKLLVGNGADHTIPTNAHITPFAAAAGVGFCQGESPGTEAEALEAVKYLLVLGADVNAADDDGFTPMHGAATRGANSIVQFLVDKGAKLDVKSKEEGWTPWTMANGVMLANTYKRQLATADYIRKLMDGGQ